MIFHDAMKSLVRDFSRSFFYWLTFALTTAFTFLFFCIATDSEIGMTFVRNSGGMETNITLFAVLVCMIEVFFANDFFVKTKSRHLAVMLICGGRFTQLAEFLLCQTFILLLVAIPVGLVGALLMMPIMQAVLSSFLGRPFSFGIGISAVGATAVVLLALVFWTTYLNMAFAYRNNALTLLNEQQVTTGESKSLLSSIYNNAKSKDGKKGAGRLVAMLRGSVSIIMFVGPLFLIHDAPGNIFVLSMIGMAGFLIFINSVVIPVINLLMHRFRMQAPKAVAYLGFLRTDIRILKINLILIVLSSVLMISIFVTSIDKPTTMMLALLTYIVMNILLSLSIMFKFATNVATRKKYYMTMSQLGYLKKDLHQIVMSEVSLLYVFLLASSMLYLGTIFAIFVSRGSLTPSFAGILILSYIIPLALCYVITLIYYFRAIRFKEER